MPGSELGFSTPSLERTKSCPYEIEWREKRRVYRWLNEVTSPCDSKKWRATRAIASFTNLPEDRVRFLCSRHPKIVLSTKEKEMWGIAGRARDEDETGVV